MSNADDQLVITQINEFYDYFGKWNIITDDAFEGQTTRKFTIHSSPKGRWVGIDILTSDNMHEVGTRISIRKDCRYLSIEGNTREAIYQLNLPKYPVEEDKEVRDLMRNILLAIKPYTIQREHPLVIKDSYHV